MSEDSNGSLTPEPSEHFAIGISFGNSNSSIAFTSTVSHHFTLAFLEDWLTCSARKERRK